ncbi:MAG TPA: hypothetical protein VFA76_12455 [Terriglobales bacterium]|nr:hypothetical protein [Terriglobales bacterium]
MNNSQKQVLDMLKFELRFLEDGGYGRSTRTPWRPTVTFVDSPICLNFNDPSRPHPCNECTLMHFVPAEHRAESRPCHFIPLNDRGQTVDSLHAWGTQAELEENLREWLRNSIKRLEEEDSPAASQCQSVARA